MVHRFEEYILDDVNIRSHVMLHVLEFHDPIVLMFVKTEKKRVH